MNDWYQHGVKVESIAIDDRAVQYGDGVFETIAVRDGRPRFWELHMQRLRHACKHLELTMPAENILERDLESALARTSINTNFCTAKIIITAGSGQRGYRRPRATKANALIGIFNSAPLGRNAYQGGVATLLCTTIVASQPKLAGIKSLNRLEQIFARAEWDSDEFFEGLMADAGNRLICGTMTNMFAVRDNKISTPALDSAGVAGVMRQLVINLLADNGIECEETEISVSDLNKVDEVFISNSQIGVVPVRRCGKYQWPVGEATRSVMAMLAYNQVPECGL